MQHMFNIYPIIAQHLSNICSTFAQNWPYIWPLENSNHDKVAAFYVAVLIYSFYLENYITIFSILIV
jgi:hypothetical protein